MLRRDYQPIVKSILIVVATTAWMMDLVSSLPTVPAGGYAIVFIGNALLAVVFATYIVATGLSRYGSRQALQLSPQTQLVLWLVGLAAILLATDGLQWFHPTASAWLFMPIALTFGSWGGLMWLWQRLGLGRGRGQGPKPTEPSSVSETAKMKPEHALWLMLAAIAFIALGAFVSSRTGAEQLIQFALALAAVYLAMTQASETKERAVLWTAGIALAVPPLATWLQLALGTTVLSGDLWRYILWARSVIVGGAAVFFGFAATPNLEPRLLVAAIGIAWLAFITLGAPEITDGRIVLEVLLVPFIIWCYWAGAQLEKGTHKDVQT